MNAKNQSAVNKIFEGRTFPAQKVEWMDVLYPVVNSKEYHAFRKAKAGLTHHDFTAQAVAGRLAGKAATRDAIITDLRTNYVNKAWKAGDVEIQIAQFLGQLSLKGWNGLVNHIIKIVEGKAK